MIKKIISKKGSHVGVVVSFVIFVTFLVFLYTIIQPSTVRERDKSYILDYITLNLIGNSTGEITTMIVNVVEPILEGKECINLQNIITSDIPPPEGYVPEYLVDHISFTAFGESFRYERSGQGFLVNIGGEFTGIITITYSEEIIKLPYVSVGGCDPHSYPTGYIKTFSEIFETKMYELNESYYTDYEALKIALGIPSGTEFNFYIYDSLRSEPPIISAKIQEPPTDRSVFVQETPIQYSDENGNKMFGFLKVEVW